MAAVGADERTRATRVNPDAVWWMRRQLWHNVRDRSGPDTPAYFYLAERFGEWPPRDRDVVRKGS